MGQRIQIHKDTAILLYDHTKGEWMEKTKQITAIYEALHYGNHSGYHIYFQSHSGRSNKYFYAKNHFKVLRKIEDVDIHDKYIYVQNTHVDAIKVEKYQENYFKVYVNSSYVFTKDFSFKLQKDKNNLAYFKDLANYGKSVISEDNPLSYILNQYEHIQAHTSSALFAYLQSDLFSYKDDEAILLPFSYNLSQLQAIKAGLTHNLSVIEGPPGTGKTQTILNMMINIITRSKTCAIVSNNNSAIENVLEKLQNAQLDFLVARLGSIEKVTDFFSGQLDSVLDHPYFQKQDVEQVVRSTITVDIKKIQHLQEVALLLAKKKETLAEVIREQKYHKEQKETNFRFKKHVPKEELLMISSKLEQKENFNYFYRLYIRFKYGINLKKNDRKSIIESLESYFYQKTVRELQSEIHAYEETLRRENLKDLQDAIQTKSKNALFHMLKKRYEIAEEDKLCAKTYKTNFSSFLERYPVVLSTIHSLPTNIPRGFLFDYLIIDEASQADLLSSILALNCARRVIVVGDSRQLQQIDARELSSYADTIKNAHNIYEGFHYSTNSLLSSFNKVVSNIPITLLKEHYRCAPDIIGFCNKMFYQNQLIIMTENKQQHLSVIKTVEGNHARKNPKGSGFYNQREIDEIRKLVATSTATQVGIITPFRYQAQLIQDIMRDSEIEADTIHKFQGREKQTIVLSFVVNDLKKEEEHRNNHLYDFITNKELLNVAISRAIDRVIVLVSDGIYHSKNNLIKDFIDYIEYTYEDHALEKSNVRSIFDVLYTAKNKEIKKTFSSKSKMYASEVLMSNLLEEVLPDYSHLSYVMHLKFSNIIHNMNSLSEEEVNYCRHPWTHVDFLVYNNVSKQPLFVIEVDGIQFHEKSETQTKRDSIKEKALQLNQIPLYRFKTNESNEKERLVSILNEYQSRLI